MTILKTWFHDNITSTLSTIAELKVPKSTIIPGMSSKVWWNDECSDSVSAKTKAPNKALRSYNLVYHVQFKQRRSEAKRCIKRA